MNTSINDSIRKVEIERQESIERKYKELGNSLTSDLDTINSLTAQKEKLKRPGKANLVGRLIYAYKSKKIQEKIEKTTQKIKLEFERFNDEINFHNDYFIKRLKIGDLGGESHEYLRQFKHLILHESDSLEKVKTKIVNVISNLTPSSKTSNFLAIQDIKEKILDTSKQLEENSQLTLDATAYADLKKEWKEKIPDKIDKKSNAEKIPLIRVGLEIYAKFNRIKEPSLAQILKKELKIEGFLNAILDSFSTQLEEIKNLPSIIQQARTESQLKDIGKKIKTFQENFASLNVSALTEGDTAAKLRELKKASQNELNRSADLCKAQVLELQEKLKQNEIHIASLREEALTIESVVQNLKQQKQAAINQFSTNTQKLKQILTQAKQLSPNPLQVDANTDPLHKTFQLLHRLATTNTNQAERKSILSELHNLKVLTHLKEEDLLNPLLLFKSPQLQQAIDQRIMELEKEKKEIINPMLKASKLRKELQLHAGYIQQNNMRLIHSLQALKPYLERLTLSDPEKLTIEALEKNQHLITPPLSVEEGRKEINKRKLLLEEQKRLDAYPKITIRDVDEKIQKLKNIEKIKEEFEENLKAIHKNLQLLGIVKDPKEVNSFDLASLNFSQRTDEKLIASQTFALLIKRDRDLSILKEVEDFERQIKIEQNLKEYEVFNSIQGLLTEGKSEDANLIEGSIQEHMIILQGNQSKVLNLTSANENLQSLIKELEILQKAIDQEQKKENT